MRSTALVAAFLSITSAKVFGATIGQVDTFQSGLSNWFAGGGPVGQAPPTPPSVVSAGGPAGSGDAYLKITSTGVFGPGSRLVVMNSAQWAGNYAALASVRIEMDLLNLGPTTETIRLFFEDPIPGPPQNEAITTFGYNLESGSGWQHAVFEVNPQALTVISGTAIGALTNTTLLRILHNPNATFPGPASAAILGIDNITLTAVPEPSSLLLTAFAIGMLAKRRFSRT